MLAQLSQAATKLSVQTGEKASLNYLLPQDSKIRNNIEDTSATLRVLQEAGPAIQVTLSIFHQSYENNNQMDAGSRTRLTQFDQADPQLQVFTLVLSLLDTPSGRSAWHLI